MLLCPDTCTVFSVRPKAGGAAATTVNTSPKSKRVVQPIIRLRVARGKKVAPFRMPGVSIIAESSAPSPGARRMPKDQDFASVPARPACRGSAPLLRAAGHAIAPPRLSTSPRKSVVHAWCDIVSIRLIGIRGMKGRRR